MDIVTRCPQCGGKLDFPIDQIVVQCKYCGSSLHLAGREKILRFYAPPKSTHSEILRLIGGGPIKSLGLSGAPSTPYLIFLPYWWARAFLVGWLFGIKRRYGAGGLKAKKPIKILHHRPLSISLPAHPLIETKLYSLGMRIEAMKIYPYDEHIMKREGKIFPIKSLKKSALEGLAKRLVYEEIDDIQVTLHKFFLLDIHLNLIYFPLWVIPYNNRKYLLIDGWSNHIIGEESRDLHSIELEDNTYRTDNKLNFIPFKCPECGWELPFLGHCIIHLCQNCGRAWRENKGHFIRTGYKIALPKKDIEQTLFLPFWEHKVEILINNNRLKNIIDLNRIFLAGTFRQTNMDYPENLYFYVPAFGLKNPNAVNRIGRLITLNQTRYETWEYTGRKKINIVGASINASDAKKVAHLLLYTFWPRNYIVFQKTHGEINFQITETSLVWLPFYKKGRSIISQMSNIAFPYVLLRQMDR